MSLLLIGSTAGADGRRVLVFDAVNAFTSVDPGTLCDQPAGTLVYVEGDVFHEGDAGGAKIGEYKTAFVKGGVAPECLFLTQMALTVDGRGDIHTESVGAFPRDLQRDKLAIVGGTNAFVGASGQCTRESLTPTSARVSCHLAH